MNRRPTLALFASLSLALSGCGGGDDGSARETAAPNAANMPVAEASLLTLGDFPSGWEAVPADEADQQDTEESREAIVSCMGVEYEELYSDGSGRADSPDFTSEFDEVVSVSVTVYDEVADAEAPFELGASAEFRDCSADVAAESIQRAADESGEDAEIGDISLNEISFDKFGDSTSAFRATIPIAVSGFEVEAVIDAVFIRVDRAIIAISSSGVGSSISTDEFEGYVQIVTDRLSTELANAS